MDFKLLIRKAFAAKVRAGLGSRRRKGEGKKRISKRDKTRAFFANNPDVTPWPLRGRLPGKFEFDFSEAAKRERRGTQRA